MTAVLCRHFGLKRLALAEDIASETFLKATEVWGINGVPANPTAWLYAVAKNKARDHLKRITLFETQVKAQLCADVLQLTPDVDFTRQTISDSQLAVIFAVCHPANPMEAQVCLALQVLCGFSIEEIATAFLTRTETIKKRLLRARANLRKDHFRIGTLAETALQARLDAVLKTLYLLFNKGYFSASGNQAIRKDLCAEAMRLTLLLTEHPPTNTGNTNALLALMCYQSSRLDARVDNAGEIILYEAQDKSLWDQVLITKGNHYLINACSGNELSQYHLEAGIAYWHTTPATADRWLPVLQLYNQLILVTYSPATALNRAFVFAKVYGDEAGIREAEKLQLTGNSHYHALLGYLSAATDPDKAARHYTDAINFARSPVEKKTLAKALERLRT